MASALNIRTAVSLGRSAFRNVSWALILCHVWPWDLTVDSAALNRAYVLMLKDTQNRETSKIIPDEHMFHEEVKHRNEIE